MNSRQFCMGGMSSTQAAGTSPIQPTPVCEWKKYINTCTHIYALLCIHAHMQYICVFMHTHSTHTRLYIFYIMTSSERKKGEEDKGNKRSGKAKKKKGKEGYRICGSLLIVPPKFQSLFFLPQHMSVPLEATFLCCFLATRQSLVAKSPPMKCEWN